MVIVILHIYIFFFIHLFKTLDQPNFKKTVEPKNKKRDFTKKKKEDNERYYFYNSKNIIKKNKKSNRLVLILQTWHFVAQK